MKQRQTRSPLSELGRLATWAAAIYLFACFIGWLMKRKSTAWIGMAVLFFIPITLGVGMIINGVIFAVEDNPWGDLCSDGLFHAEAIIGLIASAFVGIWITFSSPSGARVEAALKPVTGPVTGPMVRPKFLLWLGVSLALLFALCGLFVVWAQKSVPP